MSPACPNHYKSWSLKNHAEQLTKTARVQVLVSSANLASHSPDCIIPHRIHPPKHKLGPRGQIEQIVSPGQAMPLPLLHEQPGMEGGNSNAPNQPSL